MAQRSTNTFDEALTKLLTDISQMKVMPDADLDFVVQLETEIINKIREPQDMLAEAQAQKSGFPSGGLGGLPPGAQPPGPPMGPPPDMGAMAGMVGGAPPPMAVPGVRNEPPMPNPDELRRLLGQ